MLGWRKKKKIISDSSDVFQMDFSDFLEMKMKADMFEYWQAEERISRDNMVNITGKLWKRGLAMEFTKEGQFLDIVPFKQAVGTIMQVEFDDEAEFKEAAAYYLKHGAVAFKLKYGGNV